MKNKARVRRQWLLTLRKQKGDTQKDVALALGMSQPDYSYMETGEQYRMLPLITGIRLADYFGISISTVVRYEKEYYRQIGILHGIENAKNFKSEKLESEGA